MRKDTAKKISGILARYRRHRAWRKVVRALACVVVFCTTYALILPAITLEKNPACGVEEHTHGEDCYTQITSVEKIVPVCTLESLELHTHTDHCLDENKQICCGYADFAAHKHNERCYDENDQLWCPIPEKEAHTHDESCYRIPETHVHGEGCYQKKKGDLICTEPTEPTHTHTEGCCAPEKMLVCTLPEGEDHRHTESCYEAVLTCAESGEPAHVHTDECYTWTDELICTASTEPTEPVLTCGKEELLLHEHTQEEDCFETDEEGNTYLICGKIQIIEHVHTDECFQTVEEPVDTDSITCGLEEKEGAHTHGENCYDENNGLICQTEESEGHQHTAFCHGTWTRICGKEEHTHTDACYPAATEPEATPTTEATVETETAPVYLCGQQAHNHEEDCYSKDGKLICGIEEHAHTEECEPTEQGSAEKMSPEELANCSAIANIVNAAPFTLQAAAQNDSLDFTDSITSVDILKKEGNSWKPVAPGTQLQENDTIRFKLNYSLDGYFLSDDKRTISYQLPSAIELKQAEAGKVYDDTGVHVGDYTISATGTVEITFLDEYVDSSVEGNTVSGFIALDASASDIHTTADNPTIKFSDKVSVDVNIGEPVAEKKDITVEKTASQPDAKGNITYTVKIKSENGTNSEVRLTDVMESLSWLGGTVKVSGTGSKDGNAAVTKTDKGFTVDLPKMGPGAEYTLTYSAKLPENAVTGGSAKNTVRVESTKSDGGKIEASDEVSTNYTQTYISKSASGNAGSDTIQWTITVNAGKHDIGGWVLSDLFNDAEFTGPVTMKDSSGKTITIDHLPYTFPEGSSDTYTITYTTPADKPLKGNAPKNKANLTPPDGPGATTGDVVGPSDGKEYNPLAKEATDLTVNGDNTATVTWKVTIDAKDGPIRVKGTPTPTWWYGDTLQNGQYFTDEQFNELKQNVAAAVKGMGLIYSITPKTDSGTGNITGFNVDFYTTLAKGKRISFTYRSTAPLGDGKKELSFKNNSTVLNQVWSSGTATYKPVVQKFDDTKSGDITDHDYYDKDGNVQCDVLKWRVVVTIPQDYTGGDLTVLEKLPEGVTLQKLTVKPKGVSNQEGDLMGGECSFRLQDGHGADAAVKAQMDGGTVAVIIPEALAKHEKLTELDFSIEVKINDDFTWPQNENGISVAQFKNSVTVSSKDGKEYSADQTQIVTKDDTVDVISKSHGTVGDNIIPYTITVNPEAKDLLEGGDTLTLVDTIKIDPNNVSNTTLGLVPGSVKVYKRNADGTKGELIDPSKVPYTMRITEDGPPHSRYTKYTLQVSLPDRTALIVEYQYKVTSKDISQVKTIKNAAELKGVADGYTEDGEGVKVTIEDSSAGATTDGVTIIKVDSLNYGITLKGAVFRLSKYDAGQGKYVPVVDESGNEQLITGSNGRITLRDVVFNTAYRLEEITPPDGYFKMDAPVEFYIPNDDKDAYPDSKPANFSGQVFNGGDSVYVPNESKTTRIQVSKQWFMKDGSNVTGTKGGSILFNLYRMESTEKPGGGSADGTVHVIFRGDKHNNQWFETKEYNVKAGSVAKISMTAAGETQYNKVKTPPTVTINGTKHSLQREGDTKVFSYSVTLRSDTEIYALPSSADDWLFNNGVPVCTFQEPVPVSPTPGRDTKVEGSPFTISQAGHWTWTSDPLPKTGKNSKNQTVYYSYYVEEVSIPGCTTEYINNSGTVSGTITIQNTMMGSHKLPSTGGIGTQPYTAGGLLTVSLAALLLYSKKRRKGKSVVS